MAERPLSPHLSIYRFGYTMSLSILHRLAGVGLSLGLLLFVAWLVKLASGPDAYARFATCLGGWSGRLALALLLIAFTYHFANGLRHLLWDAGIGLEKTDARFSAKIVIAAAVVIALALLYLFLGRGVAA